MKQLRVTKIYNNIWLLLTLLESVCGHIMTLSNKNDNTTEEIKWQVYH